MMKYDVEEIEQYDAERTDFKFDADTEADIRTCFRAIANKPHRAHLYLRDLLRADRDRCKEPMRIDIIPEAADIAKGFQRVQYRYHRDFFELLGYPAIAAQWDEIWALCESHMEVEPHESLVLNQEPSYWITHLEHQDARRRFFAFLCNVLEHEATADEARGRHVLAQKLQDVILAIQSIEGMTREPARPTS